MESFVRPNIQITYDEAVHLARQVLTKYGPDHCDDSGWGEYFNYQGSPSCMVGAMLAEQGVKSGDLHALGINGSTTYSLVSAGVLVPADLRTGNFLRFLQLNNDNGHTWVKALETALTLTDGDVSLARPLPSEPMVTVGYISPEDLVKTADNFAELVASYQTASMDESKTEVLAHPVKEHVLVA